MYFFTYPDWNLHICTLGVMNAVPQCLLMQRWRNFLRTAVISGHCRKLLMQSLFRHIQFKGVLCIHKGNSFLGSNCNYLDLRAGSQLNISLHGKKMMIKTRRGLAEQMRKVKSVESLLERDKGDSQSQVCLLRKKLRGQLVTIVGVYTKNGF